MGPVFPSGTLSPGVTHKEYRHRVYDPPSVALVFLTQFVPSLSSPLVGFLGPQPYPDLSSTVLPSVVAAGPEDEVTVGHGVRETVPVLGPVFLVTCLGPPFDQGRRRPVPYTSPT